MKKKNKDAFPFPAFMAMAILIGIFFFLWGQSNTAATLYELGFLRYKAEAQLSAMAEWAVTAEEQASLDAAGVEAAAWAADHGYLNGVDLPIDNETPCPRGAVVIILYNVLA